MVPPQPYSGSPGCPPVTTTLTFRLEPVPVASNDGSAAFAVSGKPAATVVATTPALPNKPLRDIGFMCSYLLARHDYEDKAPLERIVNLLPLSNCDDLRLPARD